MFSRIRALAVLAVAAVVAACATPVATPVAAQPAPPAPLLAPAPGQRIVAVGDLHGDWNAWRQIAIAAGLMDAKGNWAGGTTIFVQTGDIPDRGPDTLKIITDLQRLQAQAPKAGGRAIPLIGNHEAMNIIGDLRYVSAGEYAAFVTPASARLRDKFYVAAQQKIEDAYRAHGNPDMTAKAIRDAWYAANPPGRIEHQAAWDPKGRIGGWVVGNPAVLKLGNTIFVHGGLSAHHADKSIDQLNKTVKAELKARTTDPGALINDQKGPLWYRGLTRAPGEAPTSENGQPVVTTGPAGVEAELDHVLKAYGASRIVIGHTPILSGISLRYAERLALIDTGISAYYGGKVAWLEIIDGKAIPHDIPRAAPAPAPGASTE